MDSIDIFKIFQPFIPTISFYYVILVFNLTSHQIFCLHIEWRSDFAVRMKGVTNLNCIKRGTQNFHYFMLWWWYIFVLLGKLKLCFRISHWIPSVCWMFSSSLPHFIVDLPLFCVGEQSITNFLLPWNLSQRNPSILLNCISCLIIDIALSSIYIDLTRLSM